MGWAEAVGGKRKVEAVAPAEAVVVLSGMLQERKDTELGEWSDAVDRFEGGVGLFKVGKAPLLIFTGGHVPWRPEDRPEGEILKERAVNLGMAEEKIVVTGKVGNTAQEAQAVKVLLESLERQDVEGGRREDIGGRMSEDRRQRAVGGKPRIILVTSAFHMRRAKMLFERRGLEVEPFPVDFQNTDRPKITMLSFVPSAEALAKSEMAMREGIGILYYSLIKR